MLLNAFTLFHVALSLVGIAAGFVVVYGFLESRRLDGWTLLFLTTTAATTVTGFLFPFHRFLPSYAVGIVSVIVLAIAIPARYRFHLEGAWRSTYVVTAMLAFYLNFFVLIAQLFGKVPPLKALAPTQTEPPFAITQVAVMVVFIILGTLAFRRFHLAPIVPRSASHAAGGRI